MKRFWIPLLLIVLLGVSLRLYNLDTESLWTDETFSIDYAQEETYQKMAVKISTTEAAPFGHYVLLRAWMSVFGDSEWAVRLPSALLGTASIVLLFLIIRKLFTKKIALLASLFMATSMVQVVYSQEARLYSLFTFLSLLSTLAFLCVLDAEKKGKPLLKPYCFYILSVALSAYTNYTTFFLVLGFTAVLWWNNTPKKTFLRHWVASHVLIAVLSLPLYPLAYAQFSHLHQGAREVFLTFGLPAFLAQLGMFVFALPFVAVLASLFLLIARKKEKKMPSPAVMGVLGGLFIIVYTALSLKPFSLFSIPLVRVPITNSYFLIRHILFLAPLLYGILAYSISRVFSRRTAVVFLLLIMLMNAFALETYYRTPTKAQWKEAVGYIESHTADQPFILLDKGGGSNYFLLQYYSSAPPLVVNLTKVMGRDSFVQMKPEEVLEIVQGKKEFWLILSKNRETGELYKALLENNFALVETASWYQIEVYHFNTHNS